MAEMTEEIKPKKGRAAALERYRAANPDITDEPDDDTMFDYEAGERDRITGEHDKLKSSYAELEGVVGNFVKSVEDYPLFREFVVEIGNGADPYEAGGKLFKDLLTEGDDDSLAKFKAGAAAADERIKKTRDNYSAYNDRFKQYVEKNNITEDEAKEINDAFFDLVELAENMAADDGVWDSLRKAKNYDAAQDAAKLAGRNDAIDEMKGKKVEKTAMPDVNGTASVARSKRQPPEINNQTYKPLIDDLEVVK
ncbi:MAG: hypothetical protein FWF72_06770 [Paludibacter sp.]|nr:hypothetical protein [Paludibacter sp.]